MTVQRKPLSGLIVPRWVAAEIRAKEQAAKQAKIDLEQKLESNAEFQRLATLSKWDIGKRAVERMVESVLTRERVMKGEDAMSEADARKKVEAMQRRYEVDAA